jgi:hypothetical protein
MAYTFKRWPEFAWAVGMAVAVVLAQAMLTFDPTTIVDWRAWAVGIAGASVRAAGGAVLAYMGSSRE